MEFPVLVGGAAMAVRWADRGSVDIDSISRLSTDLKNSHRQRRPETPGIVARLVK